MYWWNTSKLAEDLREGRVGEKERFKYFLATFIALNILVYSGNAFSIEDLASTNLSLAVIVIGTTLCYRVNKSGDNTDFIGRMICLGWPISIKITVALGGAFLFLSALSGLPSLPYGREAALSTIASTLRLYWSVFWGIFFLLPYFTLIHTGLSRIAQAHAAEKTLETGGQMLREPRAATTQKTGSKLKEAALAIFGVPLAVLGGVGIAVLFVVIMTYSTDPQVPKRFKVLFAALPAGLALLSSWRRQLDKKRGS